MALERLHKFMAACGVGSRRQCEEIIAQGRVEVDGKAVTEPGTRVDPDTQRVVVDGERLRPPRLMYFLLNKPRGVICSQKGTPGTRAIDYAPPEAGNQRLFTIGRLDVESEGALLLTNDGELCHLVSHPRFEVSKTYRVEVDGAIDDETLAGMRRGVWLAEGRTGAIDIRVIGRAGQRTRLQVTLNEGMKREIRRVCARFGHPVRRLQRVAIGPIELGRLPAGRSRELTSQEIAALRDSAQVVIRLGSTPARGGRRGGRNARSVPEARRPERPVPRKRRRGPPGGGSQRRGPPGGRR